MSKLQQDKSHQNGFTLLELLIVIALIGTLISLSVVVMSGFLTTAEVEATSATIQKTFRLLEQRIDAFDRGFKGSRKQATISSMKKLLADPNQNGDISDDGIFGVSDEAVEILAKKALFRFEFPQRLGERLLFGDPGTVVPGLPDSMYLALAAPAARASLGLAPTTPLNDPAIIAEVSAKWANHNAITESSELLYYTLAYSNGYGSSAVDSDRFTNAEVKDTDGDGLPEFVDAWEQPLRFYRWPTRLIDTHPPVPFQPILTDPNDGTDVVISVDTNNDGIPDTTVGQRQIAPLEREVASILLKGLPPAPAVLPNGAMPRDLLLTDPDDPVGILYFELERLNGANGTPIFAAEFNEGKYHTPDTFHAPLIVSAGKDGQLGLYEPDNATNFGNLAQYNDDLNGNGTAREPDDFALMLDVIADNVSNRNKRAGGK